MNIEEFVQQFVSKNDIVFKRLDKFNDFDSVELATKDFRVKNPAKVIPEGYVVTDFTPDERIDLVNLDTLVKVSIKVKNDDPFVGIIG